MLIATTFPLLDARAFVEDGAMRVGMPNWPNVQPDVQFIRHYGPVRQRVRGGFTEWPGEQMYCEARRSIRFSDSFRDAAQFGKECTRYCAFRRFFSDGVKARVDVAFGYRKCKRPLTGAETLQLIRSTVDIPIRVAGVPGKAAALITAGRALARQYLDATTRRGDGTFRPEPWWVSPGTPMVVVEYNNQAELAELPKYHRRVESLLAAGVELDHAYVEVRGQRIGVWFLGRNGSSNLDALRRLRVTLLRVHVERQSVKELLRLIVTQRLQIKPSVDPPGSIDTSAMLLDYLAESTSRLERPNRDGLPQSEILAAAQMLEDVVSEGERETLLAQLIPIRRRNLLRNVKTFTTLVMGDQMNVNNDQSITIGPNSNVSGPINQVAARTIEGSLNHIANANTSDELRKQLSDLVAAVKEMLKLLPPDQQEVQARNLEALTTEALSPKPRKKWYELSASGLLEAAETVGKIAAPVITAVKAVTALLV